MRRALASVPLLGLVLGACLGAPAVPSPSIVPVLVVNRLTTTVALESTTEIDATQGGRTVQAVIAPCGGSTTVEATVGTGAARSTVLAAFIDPGGQLDILAPMASYEADALGEVRDLVIIWSDGTLVDDGQPHVVTIAPAGVEVTLGTTPPAPAPSCGPWPVAPS